MGLRTRTARYLTVSFTGAGIAFGIAWLATDSILKTLACILGGLLIGHVVGLYVLRWINRGI